MLQQTLREIRQDRKHWKAGKMKLEEAEMTCKFYKNELKATGQMLQAGIACAKYGKKFKNQLIEIGLLGEGAIIDLTPEEVEEEKVLCPLKSAMIVRSECLDYSGSSDNFEECKDCETGIINKRLLIPDAVHVA